MRIPFVNDTIYLLELHGDGSEPIMYISGWDSKDTLSYSKSTWLSSTYESISKYDIFPKLMYQLVSAWGIEEIEKEAKNGLLSVSFIFATRIIFNGKKYKIDSIRFSVFLAIWKRI